ncbi:hypothetical protein BD410DRAFT_806072 [Rickenella mellea]|uniref:Uncharacterized protein n=1 Tax=Rickenella mellea TaxID=50990 RepID=A0A4Y7PJW3_9AGAM|nr:hypothetical protein BD410DRAFT_809401 [Rickenella mellea]TDL19135.1 hypothetical protein BD410DRAFT_806072 [Rickenella mellea]
MSSKAKILLLSLANMESFADIYSHLLAELRLKYELYQALTGANALELLSKHEFHSILVTDAGISEKKHAKVLAKVIEYAKDGGNVVLTANFSGFMQVNMLEAFFRQRWGLPWKSGSYHRTMHSLTASGKALLGSDPELPLSYSVKALHVSGISRENAVYADSDQSQMSNLTEAPVVHANVVKGHLWYDGDVNGEAESAKVVMAMIASRPKVIRLALDHEEHYDEIHAHVLDSLHAEADVIDVRGTVEALTHLNSPPAHLYGIFVTDAGISLPQNARILSKVIQYVESGGTFVIGGQFSSTIPMDDFENFLAEWNLPWKRGSYGRNTYQLSNNGKQVFKHRNPGMDDYSLLEKSFSMKASHIANVLPENILYKYNTAESRRLNEAPIVCANVGRGFFGYVGDVNGEEGCSNAILGMLGLLGDRRQDTSFHKGVSTGATRTAKRSKPRVLVISLAQHDEFVRSFAPLLAALESAGVERVHATTSEGVSEHLNSSKFTSVLVADAGLAAHENSAALRKVIEYAEEEGGRVIFGGLFAQTIGEDAAAKFFEEAWGYEWFQLGRQVAEVTLDPDTAAESIPSRSLRWLPQKYTTEVVGLRDVDSGSLYRLPTPPNRSVFPDDIETAVAYVNVGSGLMGYVGITSLTRSIPA